MKAPASQLRAVRRSILFLLLTGFYASVLLGLQILGFLLGRDLPAWRIIQVRRWGRSICRLLNLQITVQGKAPEPPFFLVCNHLSYVDIVLFFSLTDCIFVAKSDVRRWPLMGYLSSLANTMYIDRRHHRDLLRVNRLIAGNMNRHQGILLFPEGTSSAGETVLPFRPSLLAFPAEQQMPVHCAAIRYHTPKGWPAAGHSVCWWGGMTFPDHLFRLFRLPGFSATVSFAQETQTAAERKELAAGCREAVNKEFESLSFEEKKCPQDTH